jgi:soluble lytic murein transglycosylase-like protein
VGFGGRPRRAGSVASRSGQATGWSGRQALAGAAGALSLAVASVASPVVAQVIEVAPDGDATVYRGPVRTIDGDHTPIAAPARTSPPMPAPRPVAAAHPSPAFADALQAAASRRQLSDRLIEAVAWQESHFNQGAVSPKGARGVMQLMPDTARSLSVDPRDLGANLDGGAAYLAGLLRQFDGDIVLALAAYNAGPAAVRRWGGVPPYPETRAYVAGVLDRLASMAADPDGANH